MKQITVMEKYPVFTLEIAKNETSYKNIDEVFAYLKEQIAAHPIATYIIDSSIKAIANYSQRLLCTYHTFFICYF